MQTKIGVAQSIYVVALLAVQENNKPLKSHAISGILRVSDSYLKKIIRKLVVAGILTSSASKRGGLSLKKSPEQITLLDIYQAIEGSKPFFNTSDIIDTFTRFNDTYFLEKGTQALSYFTEAENAYKKVLQSYTIAELIRTNSGAGPVVDLNRVTYNDLESGKIKEIAEIPAVPPATLDSPRS